MQNIAIIGGGPVGLLSALSLKWQNPNATITVFEKYRQYTRTHTLKISLSSLNAIRPQAPLAQAQFDAMVAAIKD
jgi:2-polyprenyl-6-methoxyphenol hydroxylase-like FAD-dependent oxidoreductase